MSKYAEMRGKCAGGKYARGGRVGKDKTGRTVINIVLPSPPAGAGPLGSAPMPAPAPSGNAGAPVPPAAAAMAINQMQGKPQAPGFKRGGRVRGKCK